ncbi:FecR family protein [Portibacter marinus]|uniref:FecR family protein n=1 Tax=Portibacter marinus TaxID=2898660 RepID=UPI001F233D2A|nr:FecR family protein [Portibacter marinus]
MSNSNEKAFILIDKFHSGQASQEELNSLDDWKRSSSGNVKLFEELIRLLEIINNLKDWRTFDNKKAWHKFQSEIGSKGLRITRQIMAAAAIFIFVLAATLWNFVGNGVGNSASYLSGNEFKFSVLNDGSELFLSQDAKIYTTNFKADSRFLRTEGSYFVNVAHNTEAPFTLETERVSLKVLGTSFKVSENNDETIIKVRDGKVLITNYDGATYTVEKGRQILINDDYDVSISNIADEDWGLFAKSYEDESLFNVLNDLATEYGNLKIAPSSIDLSCRLTTKIQNSTVLEILQELDLLFNVEYSVSAGIITVHKITC